MWNVIKHVLTLGLRSAVFKRVLNGARAGLAAGANGASANSGASAADVLADYVELAGKGVEVAGVLDAIVGSLVDQGRLTGYLCYALPSGTVLELRTDNVMTGPPFDDEGDDDGDTPFEGGPDGGGDYAQDKRGSVDEFLETLAGGR